MKVLCLDFPGDDEVYVDCKIHKDSEELDNIPLTVVLEILQLTFL